MWLHPVECTDPDDPHCSPAPPCPRSPAQFEIHKKHSKPAFRTQACTGAIFSERRQLLSGGPSPKTRAQGRIPVGLRMAQF